MIIFFPFYAQSKIAFLMQIRMIIKRLIQLWKRFLIFSIFTKDQPWSNWSHRYLKNMDWINLLSYIFEKDRQWSNQFLSQKTIDSFEKLMIEFPTLTQCTELYVKHNVWIYSKIKTISADSVSIINGLLMLRLFLSWLASLFTIGLMHW